MPENIYPINVGQVEVPNAGGIGRGRSGGADNSINSLLRFQQKMAEIEARKQEQATKNSNTLFEGLVKSKGVGMEDQGKFLGFTPANEHEALLVENTQKGINEQISGFANSDRSQISYANTVANIDKLLNNSENIYAGMANKAVAAAVKGVQDSKQDVHGLWYDEVNKYRKAKTKGDYDISAITNPDQYKVTKVDINEDVDNFKEMGIGFEVYTDPKSQHNLVVTSQHNLNQIKDYAEAKYGRNYGMDFEYSLSHNDPDVMAAVNASGGNKDAAKRAYIKAKAAEYANSIATEKDKIKIDKDLGLTPEENTRRETEKAKNKLETAKGIEEVKQTNRAINDEKRREAQREHDAARKGIVDAWGSAINSAVKANNEKRVAAGKKEIAPDKVKEIRATLNETGYDDKRISDEIEKINDSYDLEYSDSQKASTLKEINEKGLDYQVKGNIGEDGKFNLGKERKSSASVGEQIGGIQSGKLAGEKDQTVVKSVDSIIIKGGKKVANVTIITKNENSVNALSPYYKDKQSKQLTKDEIKELNKKGYNLDTGWDYYQIPAEVDLGDTGAAENGADAEMIGWLESKNNYNAPSPPPTPENPNPSASKKYQFIDSTGGELTKELYPEMSKEEALDFYRKNKGDSNFQEKLFSRQKPRLKEAYEKIYAEIHADSTLLGKAKKWLGDVLGIEVDDIPDWVIKYLRHHQGSIQGAKEVLLGDNENAKDIKGLKGRIKEWYTLHGIGNLMDTAPDNKSNTTPQETQKPAEQQAAKSKEETLDEIVARRKAEKAKKK